MSERCARMRMKFAIHQREFVVLANLLLLLSSSSRCTLGVNTLCDKEKMKLKKGAGASQGEKESDW